MSGDHNMHCSANNTGMYSADRALNSAVYWQNRYCDLLEIIELFCMDAEEQHRPWTPPATIVLTEPKPDPTRGWIVT